VNKLETTEDRPYEIQDHVEKKQKYNNHDMKEYPQVRKTGVDAVHESCPQKV
jgi:hypothetical protein